MSLCWSYVARVLSTSSFVFCLQLCPSYPASVIVPVKISDDTLKASAQFRHAGRFPVLSYYHKRNGVRMQGYLNLDNNNVHVLVIVCHFLYDTVVLRLLCTFRGVSRASDVARPV